MKNTTKLLNSYIASLLVWNVKLHNIHWNVTGHLFKPVHEYTEALYDRAFGAYDDVAEILKMRDESPVATLKDSLAQSVIKEGTFKTICCSEAVAMIEADMKTMQKLAAEIRDAAAENDDFQVQAQFEEFLSGFAKDLWFIRAMRTDADAASCDTKPAAKRACRKAK